MISPLWGQVEVGRPAPVAISQVEVGTHAGFSVTGDVAYSRLGGQLVVAIGPVELVPGFNRILTVAPDTDPDFEHSGWEAMIAGRIRPLGRTGARSLWYVGVGLAIIDIDRRFVGSGVNLGFSDPGSEEFHVLLSGVSLPAGRVRLFGEVQLLDVFLRGEDQVHVFVGVNVRLR